jgi:hypothetical protein
MAIVPPAMHLKTFFYINLPPVKGGNTFWSKIIIIEFIFSNGNQRTKKISEKFD